MQKKYEKLGDQNRSSLKKFWDGVKWSAEASDLDVLRNKLVYLNGILGLVQISTGNSSLQRIQSISLKVEQGVSDIKGIIKNSQLKVPLISAIEDDRIFALSLSEKFVEHAESQRKWSAIGVDQWISAGTWWLLKSQASIQKRPASSAPGDSTSFQWYADLIKAAWILIGIIARHPQLDFLDSNTAIRVEILVETIKGSSRKSIA